MNGLILQPDWIVPIESPALRSGFLIVEAGRIVHLGYEIPEKYAPFPRVRLERCAILPGLINAHCHLEFSDLAAPIPFIGSFPDWLTGVIAQRRARASLAADRVADLRQDSLRKGIEESWRTGVRWVVDMVTSPWQAAWVEAICSELRAQLPPRLRQALVPETCVRIQPCFELVDVTRSRWEETSKFALEQMNAPKFASLMNPGLAPHAPYTASLALTQQAVAWAAPTQAWTSMHLAETREELAWLSTRSGTLGEWIAPWLDEEHRSQIGEVAAHLRVLAQGPHALVVHGNYLDEESIEILEAHRDRFAVVFCPRTHAYFGHSRHPAPELARRGIGLLIGTDSRASNPNLAIWEELPATSASLSSWSPSRIAALITTEPARHLRTEGSVGRLRVGGASQLTAFQWEGDPEVSSTGLRGEEPLMDFLLRRGKPFPLELHSALARAEA